MKRFIRLLKALFNSKPAVAAAKAVRDPQISEPVWMMLRSINTNPKRWKVVLDLPDYQEMYGARTPLRGMRYGGMTCLPVEAQVVDTITGERYKGTVYLEDLGLAEALMAKACKRPPQPIWVAMVFDHPDWMTKQEVNALVGALTRVYTNRMDKVQNRAEVRRARKVKEQREAKERIIARERERLLKVYKGIGE